MSGRAVITVTGPVPEEELGFCQSHEHLFIAKGRSFEENPALWMDDISKIRQEAARYRRAGGGTLVDAQPVGCGRMCQNLRGISLPPPAFTSCASIRRTTGCSPSARTP